MQILAPLHTFLAELKRRHVLRVAVVYLLAAWGTIQVMDIVVPRLQLPDALVTGVIVILACGFPIGLVLAWALELTPDGRIVRTPPTDDASVMRSRRPGVRQYAVLAVAVVLLYGAVGAATHRLPWPRATEIRSIAVLPFVHMSGAPNTDYLGDGIAEELLDALAGIRGLDVAARTSSFQFRDTTGDVRAIGRRLRVDAVVEGSVRRSGETLRIAAQLISTETGYHLWSGTFDRGPVEILQLQSEIAGAIADTVELRFLARGAQPAGTGGDPAAVERYWSALHALGPGTPAALRTGIAQLRDATRMDPGLARAWAALSLALIDAVDAEALDRADALAEAGAAADRALSLDEELAGAHAARGYLLAQEGQLLGAEEAFRRALVLNASHVPALRWCANLLDGTDRSDEADELRERARRLDPLGAGRGGS